MRKVLSERGDLFRLQADRDHIHTKLTVTCLTRPAANRLLRVMTAQGIEIEPMYLPLHTRDFAVAYARRPLRYTETLTGRVYNIPIRPNLAEPELQRIERALRKVVSAASA
jgi:dTDP-4-amino-4,6-dideoxygalactose transaminase